MTGNLSFLLNGKGVFGQDFALGPFEIEELYHSPFEKTDARGLAQLTKSDGKLGLELKGNFLPGQNYFHVSFSIPLIEDMILVGIRGNFNNLDLLFPWVGKGAEGRVNYLGEVKGSRLSPQVKGAIDFKGSVFPVPGFAHAFRDYSGLMFVDNNLLTFRSLQAKMGGGDVQGDGELRVGPGGIEVIDARLQGENLLVSPAERTRALTGGTLNLIKGPDKFLLKGDLFAHRLSWRREVDEEFSFYSTPHLQMEDEPGFFDDLSLDIRLRAYDDAWMENSIGRVRGKFDLTVTGNVSEPIIMGDIEALGGEVYFQDREFKLLVGRVSFINPVITEPYISFTGETYVKDYRVTFSLEGLLDNLSPEFTSSPPLPPEDVLALLALGDAFKRTYSYDASTQLSSASLLSFQLSEEATKRAEGLFAMDQFRIDPFVQGSSSEMNARLTVGKKLSKNFFVLYSTNLNTQRDEIVRMEWQLTNDISLVGTRNEEGRIAFDVKIRKRF
jgi:translocation and assembly module TamB